MGFISGMVRRKEEKLTPDDVFARNYGYSYGRKFTQEDSKHSFYAVQNQKGAKSFDIINELGLLVVKDAKFFYANPAICSIVKTDGSYLFISMESGKIIAKTSKLSYEILADNMAKRFVTEENGVYDKVATFFKIDEEYLAANKEFREICSIVLYEIASYQRKNWDKRLDRFNPRTNLLERNSTFSDEETAEKEILLLKSKIGGKLVAADMLTMPYGGDYSVHIN